jgi:hypothetical protein
MGNSSFNEGKRDKLSIVQSKQIHLGGLFALINSGKGCLSIALKVIKKSVINEWFQLRIVFYYFRYQQGSMLPCYNILFVYSHKKIATQCVAIE